MDVVMIVTNFVLGVYDIAYSVCKFNAGEFVPGVIFVVLGVLLLFIGIHELKNT